MSLSEEPSSKTGNKKYCVWVGVLEGAGGGGQTEGKSQRQQIWPWLNARCDACKLWKMMFRGYLRISVSIPQWDIYSRVKWSMPP